MVQYKTHSSSVSGISDGDEKMVSHTSLSPKLEWFIVKIVYKF